MVNGVVFEQFGVMFEMRAAARGVGDDSVEFFGRELVDLFTRELLGKFPFTVVCVKRTAAKLLGRRDDFPAVTRKNFDRVAIHVAENDVLGAAGKDGDAVFLRAYSSRDGVDKLRGELRLHRR